MSDANTTRVVGAVRQAKLVWLLQLAGNALLFAAVFGWLSLPDARWWHLVLTALLGVGIIATMLWLHAGTLLYFRSVHRGEPASWPPCGAICRRLPALAAWLVLLLAACWFVDWIDGEAGSWSAWWASWLTLKLQKPVLLPDVQEVFNGLVFLLRWFAVPLALLPVAAQVLESGYGGFRQLRRVWRVLRSWKWWLGYAAACFVGAYLVGKLAAWVPRVSGIWLETASMTVRLLVAYALAVGAWLVLLSLLARLGTDSPEEGPGVGQPTNDVPQPSDSVTVGTK